MYNINFIKPKINKKITVTNHVSSNNEIIVDKNPKSTTYADTSLFSSHINGRRPKGIGKILKKSLIK